MIDIVSEIEKLKSKNFDSIIAPYLEQKNLIDFKIYTFKTYKVFFDLENMIKHNKIKSLALVCSLEQDKEIGDYLNFKIKNLKEKFVYNNYKINSLKRKNKLNEFIYEVTKNLNLLNVNLKKKYLNDQLIIKKNYEFNLDDLNIEEVRSLIISKDINDIINYSVLQTKLNKNCNSKEIVKI